MEEFVSGIKISHPDRVVYKNDSITKLEVARYYDKVKERIFPYSVQLSPGFRWGYRA